MGNVIQPVYLSSNYWHLSTIDIQVLDRVFKMRVIHIFAIFPNINLGSVNDLGHSTDQLQNGQRHPTDFFVIQLLAYFQYRN